MAEIQTVDQSGEMTRRFIEFVMMHAQNAALFLGETPNPATGKAEVNLDLARLFIDQLEMIAVKTRGNLSRDEEQVLTSALTQLRLSFVRADRSGAGGTPSSNEPTAKPAEASNTSKEEGAGLSDDNGGGESKKKFTKSYGA